MNSLATSAPAVKQFGENFYSSRKSIQNLEELEPVITAKSGITEHGLGTISINSNGGLNIREKLLSQNKYKLNRQLKQSLVVNGVVRKKAVVSCLQSCISAKKEVEIHLPKGKSYATLKNVFTCKNFWMCPVCRSNLLKQKRKDIQAVVSKSKTNNIMATFTLRHKRGDNLLSMVDAIQKASSDLWTDRVWLGLKKKYQFDWWVRNIEVTWGKKNGFHVHIHCLIGSLSDWMNMGEVEEKLYQAWNRLVQKYGMRGLDRDVGVNVIPAENAGEYLAKWSMSSEMAGEKKGKGDNVSIGDLELDVLGYTTDEKYDGFTSLQQTSYLLQEYHEAFARRKFLQPGGQYNKILKADKDEEENKEEEEEIIEDETVVFVNGSFWSKLSHAGYSMDFVAELEVRDIPEAMNWLCERWKNTDEVLDNVRVVEHHSGEKGVCARGLKFNNPMRRYDEHRN